MLDGATYVDGAKNKRGRAMTAPDFNIIQKTAGNVPRIVAMDQWQKIRPVVDLIDVLKLSDCPKLACAVLDRGRGMGYVAQIGHCKESADLIALEKECLYPFDNTPQVTPEVTPQVETQVATEVPSAPIIKPSYWRGILGVLLAWVIPPCLIAAWIGLYGSWRAALAFVLTLLLSCPFVTVGCYLLGEQVKADKRANYDA